MLHSRRLRLLALLALSAVVLIALWGLFRVGQRGVQSALNPGGFRNLETDVAFVGDAACESCHEDIAASYARTGMANSWANIRKAGVETFAPATPAVIESPTDGLRYTIEPADDGRLLVTETDPAIPQEFVPPLTTYADYVLGSGHKGRSYVMDSGGHLWLMPVAWYSRPRTWSLSPGFEHFNRRFSRPIVTRCWACHNGYARHVPYSDSKYEPPLPEGITCERCHGPGALHVAERQNDPPNRTPTGKDLTIVNPAHLSPELQQDVCLQCHLATEVAVVMRGGASAFDFQPGQPLHAFRLDFLLAGPEAEELSAVSHGSRMALSRCYTRSGGRLICTYCHDPHKPSWETPREVYNSRCMTCHEASECTRPAHLEGPADLASMFEKAHRTADCVACHMPRRDPKDIRHTTTTDHWIRKHALTEQAPPPGPPTPPERLVALVDYFRVATPGERGIAHVMYGHTWQRADYLQYGLRLINDQLADDRNDPRLLYWASLAHADLGDLSTARVLANRAYTIARGSWNSARMTEEEQLDLMLDLIHYELDAGRLESAVALSEELLELAPESRDAQNNRIHLALLQGDIKLAHGLAHRATQNDPSNWLAWYYLAEAIIVRKGNPERALEASANAIKWNPLDVRTWLGRARAFNYAGQPDKAIRVLDLAAERFPDALEPLLALAELYHEQGNEREARRYLLRARERAPGDPRLRRLTDRLEGKVPQATRP